MRFFPRQLVLLRSDILLLSFLVLVLLLRIEPAVAENKQEKKNDYRDIANKYLKNGNYPEAIKWCQEAIRVNPKDSRGYAGLGWAYCRIGNYPEAIKWCQEAIRINPKYGHGYAVLGRVYLGMGNYPEAMKWLKQAIKLNPHDGLGYDGLGWVYFYTGELKLALKYLKDAKKNIPTNYACPYQGFGNIYRKLGKPRLAEENFLKEVRKTHTTQQHIMTLLTIILR